MAKSDELQSGRENRRPGPIVLAINICDTVIRDEMTKKVSLIGLFGVIYAHAFPCTHPLMYIHVAMTGGHDNQEIEIRIVRLADDQTIARAKGPVQFPNPLHVAEVVLGWAGLTFEQPGEYAVEVSPVSDTSPWTRKFNVVLLSQDLRGPGAKEE